MTVAASVTLESCSSDETLELNYSRAHGDMGSMMGGKLGSDNTLYAASSHVKLSLMEVGMRETWEGKHCLIK